jgi:CotH kinase protein
MGSRAVLAWAGLTALVALGLVALAPPWAQADEAAPIYDPSSVAVIELAMPQSSMEALEADPPSDEYQPGTFSLALGDGTPNGVGELSPPLEVGIRLKGSHGSFRPLADHKAGFKIKLNFVKGRKFLGLKKLTLNNMVQDPSMVHETLSYELFRAMGLPAPRTGYAYVRLNGVDYGVYLNLEAYDDISLPRWFGSTRHLYEADAPGTDVVPGGAEDFEVDEGDDEDLADLEALIAAVAGGPGDWSDGIDPVADLVQMTRAWAVERYVGHWDGYAGTATPSRPNNYYLHSDGAGRFSMLPWGTDQTWGSPSEFDEAAGGLLVNRCFADSDCWALYVDALADLPAQVAALGVGRQASCLAERLAPWQALEDEGRREYGPLQIAAGLADTRRFIADRPAELAAWLGAAPPPTAPAPPCRQVLRGDLPLPPPPTAGGQPRLRLGRIHIDGGLLKARLTLPAPGWLKLEAWLGGGSSGRRACEPVTRFHRAAVAPVSCPLAATASRRLRWGTRPLTVRATLATRDGGAIAVSRTVELPRR